MPYFILRSVGFNAMEIRTSELIYHTEYTPIRPESGVSIGRLSGVGALWDCVPSVCGCGGGCGGGGVPLGAVPVLSWCGEVSLGGKQSASPKLQVTCSPPLGASELMSEATRHMHPDADPPALPSMVHLFKVAVFVKLATYESNAVFYSSLRIFRYRHCNRRTRRRR